MKTSLLLTLLILGIIHFSFSQNVFNPSDPIVRYSSSQPLGSAQHPDPNKRGLQKWVSTPTNGVSAGTDQFNASSFKQYFINHNGSTPLAFRIKFPKSYSTNPTARFPVMIFLHGAGEAGCSSNGGVYNNEKQLWLGGNLFMGRVDNGSFDGFLLYPQLVENSGCWGVWGTTSLQIILQLFQSVVSLKQTRLDADRVIVDGLSGGGYGAWRFADLFPQESSQNSAFSSSG